MFLFKNSCTSPEYGLALKEQLWRINVNKKNFFILLSSHSYLEYPMLALARPTGIATIITIYTGGSLQQGTPQPPTFTLLLLLVLSMGHGTEGEVAIGGGGRGICSGRGIGQRGRGGVTDTGLRSLTPRVCDLLPRCCRREVVKPIHEVVGGASHEAERRIGGRRRHGGGLGLRAVLTARHHGAPQPTCGTTRVRRLLRGRLLTGFHHNGHVIVTGEKMRLDLS